MSICKEQPVKRDWDLVRDILLRTESLAPTESLTLSDFNDDQKYLVAYHVKMLTDSGILHSIISSSIGNQPTQFHVRELTWEGHEFLDSIRVETTWMKVKDFVKDKGGVMTFDVIKAVAANIIKSAM